MVDTSKNIKIPANTWVDIYAARGITVGVQISVTNLSIIIVKLNTKATTPSADDAKSNENGAYYPLPYLETISNKTGDSGAWAYCTAADGLVNVSVS